MTRHPQNKRATRRDFLKTSTVAAGSVAAGTVAVGTVVPYFAWSQSAFANNSANDRPRVGCIGLGGRGMGTSRDHAKFGDIVAICDVDLRHAERAKADKNIGSNNPDLYKDYRRVLERDDIDTISIVTPDHWHVKIAVEALEAGKHIFCEKPLTLTLEENQLIRRACEKHSDKIFQVGTWQRSQKKLFLRAVNMVQKGLLGDIKKVTIGIDGSPQGGPFPTVEIPKELDWDMWLGQAPKVKFRTKNCHRNFRWWHEYSGGKFTDWGAHHIDIALWALGQDGPGMGPVEFDGRDANFGVEMRDGMPVADDSYNTATDFNVKCRFANGIQMDVGSRVDNGILFEGDKGRIFVNRSKITGTPIKEQWDEGKYTDEDIRRLHHGKPNESYMANFYRCMREGGLPMSDVFTHVQTMNSCHLATIASRLKRIVKWDPAKEQILDDPLAASFFARERRQGFEILSV